MTDVRIHSSAEVSPSATIGSGTAIWNDVQVREGARIGVDCTLGKGVYVDENVVVGDRVKLENGVSVFKGTTIGSGVFIGPHTALLNDRRPRSVDPDGALKGPSDWTIAGVTVSDGASIGGGCTVVPGVTIGAWAMIGAGSVVTRDVPPHSLVFGNPARPRGFVCECGETLAASGQCPACKRDHEGARLASSSRG